MAGLSQVAASVRPNEERVDLHSMFDDNLAVSRKAFVAGVQLEDECKCDCITSLRSHNPWGWGS